MSKENEKRLIDAIKRVCRLEVESDYIDNLLSSDECDIKASLGFESLLIVELVVEIEDEFGFEFDMNQLNISSLKIVGSLKKLVENYIEK